MSYETISGRDVALDWDTDKTFAAELAFIAMLKNCQKIKDYRQWTAWRHPMKGTAGKAGVVELGFKASGRHYRVLCAFNGKCALACFAWHITKNLGRPPKLLGLQPGERER